MNVVVLHRVQRFPAAANRNGADAHRLQQAADGAVPVFLLIREQDGEAGLGLGLRHNSEQTTRNTRGGLPI